MGAVTGRVTCKMAHLEARDCQVEGLPELWPIFFLVVFVSLTHSDSSLALPNHSDCS